MWRSSCKIALDKSAGEEWGQRRRSLVIRIINLISFPDSIVTDFGPEVAPICDFSKSVH